MLKGRLEQAGISRAEWVAIAVLFLTFCWLLLFPSPQKDETRMFEFLIVQGDDWLRQTPSLFEHAWSDLQSLRWKGAVEVLMYQGLAVAICAGLVLAATQPLWWLLQRRQRLFLWDLMGAVALVWLAFLLFMISVHGQPQESARKFVYLFLAYLTMASVAALAFGHLGSVLFRRRPPSPPQRELTRL